jgi:uncharacterized protein YjiS (DUF1127 family)
MLPKIIRMTANQIVKGTNYRRTVRELSRLSDHELQDIGITRNSIHAIAAISSGFAKGTSL